MDKGSFSSSESQSNINHFPSNRSRKSVLKVITLQYMNSLCNVVAIKGSPAFVWNNEVTRTDAPYYDKRYHIAYDLPPNEVNFVGGLGRPKGNARSKV